MKDSVLTYTADDEFIELLKEAARSDGHVTVFGDDETFDIEVRKAPGRDIWEGYDPEVARKALRETFGILADSGIDVEKWIQEIREAREQNTPGRPDW